MSNLSDLEILILRRLSGEQVEIGPVHSDCIRKLVKLGLIQKVLTPIPNPHKEHYAITKAGHKAITPASTPSSR